MSEHETKARPADWLVLLQEWRSALDEVHRNLNNWYGRDVSWKTIEPIVQRLLRLDEDIRLTSQEAEVPAMPTRNTEDGAHELRLVMRLLRSHPEMQGGAGLSWETDNRRLNAVFGAISWMYDVQRRSGIERVSTVHAVPGPIAPPDAGDGLPWTLVVTHASHASPAHLVAHWSRGNRDLE